MPKLFKMIAKIWRDLRLCLSHSEMSDRIALLTHTN